MIVKLLTEQHLEFLSFNGDCTGSSESSRQNATLLEITLHGSIIVFLSLKIVFVLINSVDPSLFTKAPIPSIQIVKPGQKKKKKIYKKFSYLVLVE